MAGARGGSEATGGVADVGLERLLERAGSETGRYQHVLPWVEVRSIERLKAMVLWRAVSFWLGYRCAVRAVKSTSLFKSSSLK